MRNTIRTIAGAVSAAAIACAPIAVATASVSLLSADAAWAGKGNGGGNGGGERGERGGSNGNRGEAARGNGRSQQEQRMRGNGRSQQIAGARGNGRGQQMAGARGNAGSAGNAGGNGRGNAGKGNPAVLEAKANGTHPGQLGNMNGALNANINAVLAHIRNGNTNGPVGKLAALAVADATAADAAELLGSTAAQEQILLRDALAAAGYEGLEAYRAAVEADPTLADPAIDTAVSGLGAGALADALSAAGYGDLAAYEAAVAENPALADAGVEDALAALGTVDQELLDRIAAAEGDLAAVSEAEQALLDFWNKNGDADPTTLTAEEQALLDALRARLEPYGDAIDEAMQATDVAEADPDDAKDGPMPEEGEALILIPQ